MTNLRVVTRLAQTAAITAAVVLTPLAWAQSATGSWLQLFDGETTYGWNQIGASPWSVQDGAIVCDSGCGGLLATTAQFKDFELNVKMKVKPGCSSGLMVRGALEGHPTETGSTVIPIAEPKNGSGDWHQIHVEAVGDSVKATVDGNPVDITVGSRKVGYIGIQYHHNRLAKVEVSEVQLRPLSMQSIFNGKDLTGWNIIPGHKSVFSVDNGALHIVHGNGQIETDGVYKDFCLQLDIFSNGDHLNSGVFYRSPKGVFWKGYESQVRNQWIGDDRTKPIDYGTGGNYGNCQARKVVSSDRKWFTMTVLADGNHTSVWVNGYQVSDFTDNRPVSPDKQGKDGYVPGPGTINLQGHDPTTDLSFKNIIIEPY